MPKTSLLEVSAAVALAVHCKESCVRHAESEESSFAPPVAMMLDSGGEILTAAIAPHCDKQLGLDAVYALRIGFGADRVAVAFDAYHPARRSARPGEFQERALAGATRQDDGIGSILIVFTAGADGSVEHMGLPYERAGKAVAWLDPGEPHRPRNASSNDGPLIRALKAAMAATPMAAMPEVLEAAAKCGIDDPEEIARMPRTVIRKRLAAEGFALVDFRDGSVVDVEGGLG